MQRITKKQRKSSRAYYERRGLAMSHFNSNQPMPFDRIKSEGFIESLVNLLLLKRRKTA